MTPYEYFALAQGNISNAIGLLSLSIAILSGYLVVTYMVGAKLTRVQVVVLNFVYTLWLLFQSVSSASLLADGVKRARTAAEMLGEPFPYFPYAAHMNIGISLLLLVTSLWFMWSVRHPGAGRKGSE